MELLYASSHWCGTEALYMISKSTRSMKSKPSRRADAVETSGIIAPLRISEID
jgi:hypothetical protein